MANKISIDLCAKSYAIDVEDEFAEQIAVFLRNISDENGSIEPKIIIYEYLRASLSAYKNEQKIAELAAQNSALAAQNEALAAEMAKVEQLLENFGKCNES